MINIQTTKLIILTLITNIKLTDQPHTKKNITLEIRGRLDKKETNPLIALIADLD